MYEKQPGGPVRCRLLRPLGLEAQGCCWAGQLPLCGDQAAEGPGSNGVCGRDKTEQGGKEGGSYEACNMCPNTISFPYTHKETSIPSYPVLVCTLLLFKV